MADKGGFDILFDNVKSILESFSASQPEKEWFRVHPDSYRPLASSTAGAYVFLTLGPMNPTSQAGQAYFAYKVTINLDLMAIGKGIRSESDYTKADEAAGIRYRCLIQQVLVALYPSINRNLGMPKGAVSEKPLLSLQPFPEDMQVTEKVFAGGRLLLTMGLAWSPEKTSGTELEEISVSADKWSALYEN